MAQRALLVLTISGALAAFAGAYTWATVPLFVAALMVALSAPRRTFHFPASSRTLDLALIAIALAMAVQLIPLPMVIVDAVSPQAMRLRGILRLDALTDRRAVALSIDPRATTHALLTYASAVLLFWSTRAVFSSGGARQFCRIIALLGLVVCVEAMVQRAVSPLLIYGFWRPRDIGAQPFGPFVNRNHFAGWVLMALPLVIGYLTARLRTRISGRRIRGVRHVLSTAGPMLLAAAAVLPITLLATFSRSALLGLGAAAMGGWQLARRRMEGGPKLVAPLLAGGGIALVLLMTVVDLDMWTRRLGSSLAPSETGRLTIWRESLPAVSDFAVAGTGAGTYSTAMLVYQVSVISLPHLQTTVHFNQAHSHYVQLAVEGGALLLLPVLVAVVGLVRLTRRMISEERGEAMWIRIGAVTALIGIAVQSIWETPLLMPANAFLCAALAGLAVHRRVGDPAAPLPGVEEPGHRAAANTAGHRGHLMKHRRGKSD